LWRDNAGNVAVWFMKGAQVIQTASFGNVGAKWLVVGADNKGDIFSRDSITGAMAMGVFGDTHIVQAVNRGVAASVRRIVGFGDFYGDGSTDILWQDNFANVAIWFMNGTRIAQTVVLGSVGPSWTVALTGDFDGDGKSDILWRDNVGNVAAWFMNGAKIS